MCVVLEIIRIRNRTVNPFRITFIRRIYMYVWVVYVKIIFISVSVYVYNVTLRRPKCFFFLNDVVFCTYLLGVGYLRLLESHVDHLHKRLFWIHDKNSRYTYILKRFFLLVIFYHDFCTESLDVIFYYAI